MYTFLISLLLFTNPFATSDSISVTSEIKEVTVYRQQAQIQRQATANLKAGKNIIVFEQLSPTLNQNSIQLKANGKFTVLSLTQRYNYFTKQKNNPAVLELEIQLDSLQQQITLLNSDRNVIQREMRLLESTTAIIDNNEVTAAELTQFLDLYRTRATKLEREQIELNETISEKQNELNKIRAQIRELTGSQRERFAEVIAEVHSDQAQTLTFTLSHLVRAAGWTPSYDIRSEDISSPLSINYKAEVYQNTGIDWNDVDLTVNSGNPSANATLPAISPAYVDFIQAQTARSAKSYADIIRISNSGIVQGRVVDGTSGEAIIGANVSIQGTNKGTATDRNGNFMITNIQNGNYILKVDYVGYNSLSQRITLSNTGIQANVFLNPAILGLEEVVVSSYAEDRNAQMKAKREMPAPPPVQEVESQTSFSYKINTPYSVPSDGKAHTVEIKRSEVDTDYSYSTIPKYAQHAFLIGKMSDWDDLNLIAGEANIYFENSFIGTTRINPNTFDDTLSVSLGRDESIVIERTKLRDFEERNFFGNKVREKNAWEINIRNTKSEAISIKVQDQLPISRNEDIQVEANRLSGGTLDKQTGIVTWQFTLAPNSSETIRFDYQVEYPSDQQIRY